MRILVDKIGKKFIKEWIIKDASFELSTGNSYTFVGPNGSGKSTLIQLLTGIMPVTKGTISFIDNTDKKLHIDVWYKNMVIAAPYMELVEEFTLRELIAFHGKFKPYKNLMSPSEIEDFMQLAHAKNKSIRHFSSGMKQRLKLGLAFLSDVPIVFLDEPTANLDSKGIDWYLENIDQLLKNQMVILGSNMIQEYEFCKNIISVSSFK